MPEDINDLIPNTEHQLIEIYLSWNKYQITSSDCFLPVNIAFCFHGYLDCV